MTEAIELRQVGELPFLASRDGRIFNKNSGKEYTQQLSRSGYYEIHTRIKFKAYSFRVHRLVAIAYLENPNNLPVVNHKDENKRNNNVNNLEWCTQQYNCNYGNRNNKLRLKNLNNKQISKSVLMCNLNGDVIREFPSIMEVERIMGFSNANISSVCRNKRHSCGGYIWRYSI